MGGIIAQRCEEKNIRFVTDVLNLDGVGITGDKLRLKQVLINLLENAVKFTNDGGEILFKTGVTDETEDKVTLHFLVEDNGIGTTEEQVSRLFNTFEQADNATAIKYGGTGLGLAISQNMVRKMGGEIAVVSTVGQGSRFWFDLSLPKSELVEEVREEDGPVSLTGRRILLVEDVLVNRLILVELLADTDITIDQVEDGVRALEQFSNSSQGYYDMILMDIQMPRMDGYETTRAIPGRYLAPMQRPFPSLP